MNRDQINDINQEKIVRETDLKKLQEHIQEEEIIFDHKFQDGETLLFKAISNGNEELVKIILDNGVDPDTPNIVNATIVNYPIWEAASKGYDNIIELLLSKSRKATDTANQGLHGNRNFPLILAVESGNPIAVKSLLRAGAHTDYYDLVHKESAMDSAIKMGSSMMELLLEAGEGPDGNYEDGNTMMAVINIGGDESSIIEKLRLLLKFGAKPGFESRIKSPLIAAALKGYSKVMEFLLQDARVDPNKFVGKSKYSTLLWAAKSGSVETMRVLLKYGVPIDVLNEDAFTVLFYTLRTKRDNITTFLLENGASPNLLYDGYTPLSYIIKSGHFEYMSMLIKAKANPNIPDKNGNTPLVYMIRSNSEVKHVNFILESGANPNIPNYKDHGMYPLWYAITKKDIDLTAMNIIASLIEYGANENVTGMHGLTLLMEATRTKYLEVMKLLLNVENKKTKDGRVWKADPNKFAPKELNYFTALHNAIQGGFVDGVKLLLEYGANPNNAKKGEDFTLFPLWYAIATHVENQENIDIIALLLKYGADENTIVETGRTVLIEATSKWNLEAMKLLLNVKNETNNKGRIWKSNPNQFNRKNLDEYSALYIAISNGDVKTVKLLLEHGADPNKGNPNEKITLLDYSKSLGQGKIHDLLVKHGARYAHQESTLDTKRMKLEKLMHKKFSHMKLIIETNFGKSKILYHKGGGFCEHVHDTRDLIKHLKNENATSPCPKCK